MRKWLVPILFLVVMLSLLSISPKPSRAADKEKRALHFWGKITEIDPKTHHFTVEGRWAIFGAEEEEKMSKAEPEKKLEERTKARFIHVVENGPAIHPKTLKFCCVEGQTVVWKDGEAGKCGDLMKGDYVRVWAQGECPKEE